MVGSGLVIYFVLDHLMSDACAIFQDRKAAYGEHGPYHRLTQIELESRVLSMQNRLNVVDPELESTWSDICMGCSFGILHKIIDAAPSSQEMLFGAIPKPVLLTCQLTTLKSLLFMFVTL